MADESGSQTVTVEPVVGEAVEERVVAELAEWARAEGLQMTGAGGLLPRLTKRVFEAALQGEMDDHLGYGKHDPAGRDGGNSRNGTRAKTVLTDVGPVEIEVPRDRDSSFAPQLVKKRQRRLTDRVMDGMAEWENRPLDRVYPVIFIDCIHVKIREGTVANRPIYVALAVTVDGTRDILGLWAGEHGDGEGSLRPLAACGVTVLPRPYQHLEGQRATRH